MSERHTSHQFTFGSPEDDTSADVNSDVLSLKIKKLSRRVTLQGLLLPILAALIVAYGYLAIQDRLLDRDHLERNEVEKLAQEVDERFADLTKRLEGADKRTAEGLAKTQAESTAALKHLEQNLAALQNAVNSIDVTGAVQAVEKRQKALAAEAAGALKPLEDRLESLSDDLKIIDARLSEKVAALSDQTSQNRSRIDAVAKKANALGEGQLNREQLDLELLKVKKAQQVQLESELESVRRQLKAISETIERLEARMAKPSFSQGSPPAAAAAPPKGIREQPIP